MSGQAVYWERYYLRRTKPLQKTTDLHRPLCRIKGSVPITLKVNCSADQHLIWKSAVPHICIAVLQRKICMKSVSRGCCQNRSLWQGLSQSHCSAENALSAAECSAKAAIFSALKIAAPWSSPIRVLTSFHKTKTEAIAMPKHPIM